MCRHLILQRSLFSHLLNLSGIKAEIKTGWKRALMDAGSPWDPFGPSEGKACDNDLEAAHLADHFTNG